MPEVSRQGPKGPVRQVANGSILSRVRPVSEIITEYLKINLYAQNRVGKTTLACTFPKPLLLASFEPEQAGGARSVKLVPGVEFVHLRKTAEAELLAKELIGDTTYKTHVLDGGSNWERMHLADVLGIDPDGLTEQLGRLSKHGITRDQYTERTERMKNQLRKFLNLKAHTLVVCREKDHQKPEDAFQPRILRQVESKSFVASDLSSATMGWLMDACDICRLYVAKEVTVSKRPATAIEQRLGKTEVETEEETGRIIRRLRMTYHPNYAAGFRSSLPKTVPDDIDEPTYEKIARVMRGEPLEQ